MEPLILIAICVCYVIIVNISVPLEATLHSTIEGIHSERVLVVVNVVEIMVYNQDFVRENYVGIAKIN